MMFDNQKMSICLPARIVEYFPEDQTATVQISAETVFSDATSTRQVRDREPIEGVPVHTLCGGGWAMTMPIKAGNTCVMFFSQIGYDHWLYEDKDKAGTLAGNPKPWMKRQFNEDDGFALVGFNTLPRAIKKYSGVNSEWRNEDATQIIRLKEDLAIEIDSPVSVTINAPSVVVNCETADINASTSTTIDSPSTTITGTLDVGGAVTMSATLDVTDATTIGTTLAVTAVASLGGLAVTGAGAATMAGGLDASGPISASEVTAAGVTLSGHNHTDSMGGTTSPPN